MNTTSRVAATLIWVLVWAMVNPVYGQPKPDEELDFHQRLALIHQLSANLPEQDIQRFLNWIRCPSGEPGEATLKNDLLNVLRAQEQPVAELAPILSAMIADPSFSHTLRDYAVQHLGTLPGNENVLWQATVERGGSIAGTALLALFRLEADPGRLGRLALSVATDDRADDSARIPALRICGRLALNEVVPTARALIEGGSTISLQLAAVATLGELGEHRDLALLGKLLEGDQERLKPAAARALWLLTRHELKKTRTES